MDNTQTVLVGSAVAIFVLAVTLAGWRHRVFLATLFAASAVLVVLAATWNSVRINVPNFAAPVDAAAASRFLWLGIPLLCLAAVVHAQWRMRRHTRQPVSITRPAPTAPPDQLLPVAADRVPKPNKPLNETERGPCLAALIDLHNFLTGDVATFHNDLAEARNSPKLAGLLTNILQFQSRAEKLRRKSAGLANSHALSLDRMRDMDLAPLTVAFRGIATKVAGVYQGREWPRDALMERVRPLNEANHEMRKLVEQLTETVRAKRKEYFDE